MISCDTTALHHDNRPVRPRMVQSALVALYVLALLANARPIALTNAFVIPSFPIDLHSPTGHIRPHCQLVTSTSIINQHRRSLASTSCINQPHQPTASTGRTSHQPRSIINQHRQSSSISSIRIINQPHQSSSLTNIINQPRRGMVTLYHFPICGTASEAEGRDLTEKR